jgi:hypothetical protein
LFVGCILSLFSSYLANSWKVSSIIFSYFMELHRVVIAKFLFHVIHFFFVWCKLLEGLEQIFSPFDSIS